MSSFFLFFFLLFLPVQVRVNSSASSRSLFCSERILRGRFCIKVHSVQNTKKPAPFRKQVSLPVQEEGLEPSWYCYHTDLNRARLPIPPLLHFFSAALFISLSDMLDYIIKLSFCQQLFQKNIFLKSQAINAKLYLRNIISSFCTTLFAFCWQICTDCPSFRFALCLFYSFYASLASSSWNSSPEVFHPNISLG